LPALVFVVVNLTDVGVIQSQSGARFALKASHGVKASLSDYSSIRIWFFPTHDFCVGRCPTVFLVLPSDEPNLKGYTSIRNTANR